MSKQMLWRCDLEPQHAAYEDEVLEAIKRVLPTGRYVLAKEVAAFEQEFADYCGSKFGVGVANATDALTLCLQALDIGPGDEVITTPYTAIPTVSAIVAAGATPVFVDICADTWLLDLNKVAAAITSATKAIMPVHIFGNMVDIPALKKIAGEDVAIVEDASQAHGASIRGMKAGSMGDLGVFSFYPTKNLGAYGDGGIAVTNDEKLRDRLKLLRMYGMVDKDHISSHGINSRLDELQAAILRAKLPHLNEMNANRNRIADRYNNELPVEFFKGQHIPEEVVSNYHVYVTKFSGNRNGLIEHLDNLGIQTNIYYVLPLHLQEATKNLGYKIDDLPVAEALCDEAIALTLYPELLESDQDRVIEGISQFVKTHS
ncbi:DegT/DnrJ/EryC1/StrS family aminotransferase [Akkermansiaceae bacterium]|nr:DegT/DnrJ/EryC1/StrS family aminotransferase [bacterium]MDA8968768.1 DegT/DnrJ/EryC1/StrS family aminotransferase [Akkermansiaceae bacterium]